MMKGYILTGDVFLGRLTNTGGFQGFGKAGNAIKLEVKPDAEIKELTSNMRDTFGNVLDSVTISKPTTVALAMNQLDHDVIAMAAMGDTTVINVTAGSVTGEAVVAIHDKFVALANEAVSSAIIQDETDTTTYVAGTDYELINNLGLIKVLSTGAIADGATLHASYTNGNITGHRVSGSTNNILKVYILLDGKNLNDNSPCIARLYEAQLKPTSPINLLAADFSEVEFEGTLLLPAGKTAAYDIDLLDA